MKLLTALLVCVLISCVPTRPTIPAHAAINMPANTKAAYFTESGVWVVRVDEPTLNQDGSVSEGSVVVELHPFSDLSTVTSTVKINNPK
jgi:hypothetical protein